MCALCSGTGATLIGGGHFNEVKWLYIALSNCILLSYININVYTSLSIRKLAEITTVMNIWKESFQIKLYK